MAAGLLALLSWPCNEALNLGLMTQDSCNNMNLRQVLLYAGQLEQQAPDAMAAGPLLALLSWLCNEALDTPALHSIFI